MEYRESKTSWNHSETSPNAMKMQVIAFLQMLACLDAWIPIKVAQNNFQHFPRLRF